MEELDEQNKARPRIVYKQSRIFKIVIALLLLACLYFAFSNTYNQTSDFKTLLIPIVVTVIIFIGLFIFFTYGVEKTVKYSYKNIKPYFDKSYNEYKITSVDDKDGRSSNTNGVVVLYPNKLVCAGAVLISLCVDIGAVYFIVGLGLQAQNIFVPGMILQAIFIIIVFMCLVGLMLYIVNQTLIIGYKNIFFKKPSIILSASDIGLHSTFKSGMLINQKIDWQNIEKIGESRPYITSAKGGGYSLNKYITMWLKNGGIIYIRPSMLPITKRKFLDLLKNYPVKIEI